MIRVDVTAQDIAAGLAKNCQRCPVALALGRAGRDDYAAVVEIDFRLHLELQSRWIAAPQEVVEFVERFDAGLRCEPFRFELPDLDDPEWQEQCNDCERLLAPDGLDRDGYCPECNAEYAKERA